MLTFFQKLLKNLSSLVLALLLAVTVWITAITEADPTEDKTYPKPVTVELVGQDPSLVLTTDTQPQITLSLRSPRSIWDRILREQIPIRAVADLSGLDAGIHEVPVQIQVGIQPAKVVSYAPRTISLSLDPLSSRVYPIKIVQHGEPAIGFQAEKAVLSQSAASVSGPESLVREVAEIVASLDIDQAVENLNRSIPLTAVRADESVVEGVTITPSQINVTQKITQRGGYRNVVVKAVLGGQVISGYRVTNISVYPPVVTVFSSDPQKVEELPGYIETAPVDLTGIEDDVDISMPLNLPAGISVIGQQSVKIQVGIAAIEGSVTLNNMRIEITGMVSGSETKISPEMVDVIISGPLPLLDSLKASDVRVEIDLTDISTGGTYQRAPKVTINIPELRVESILPASVEINMISLPTQTPTRTQTRLPGTIRSQTPSPTPTPEGTESVQITPTP